MAGTDPITDATVYDADLETRKEIQRLRSLFIRPNQVFLVTVDNERWLTDRYVIVKVTGSLVLKWTDGMSDKKYDCEWADGPYRLMASKGLVSLAKEILIPDTAGLLGSLADREVNDTMRWLPMTRTNWSMADSEAKLMLAFAQDYGHRFQLAINEGIWQAFVDAYPGCPVNFEFYDDETPYRVSCDCGVIGYVAHAEFPKEMYEQADVLVDWLVRHDAA